MASSAGIRVPATEAEATRRRLSAEGRLRNDLAVTRDGGHVVFPVDGEGPVFDFPERTVRPRAYTDLLDDPTDAPRAFEAIGDIVMVKVPPTWTDRETGLGDALLRFHEARAVFHDDGVTGPFRVRALRRIAGQGDSATIVQENGCRLHVDPARAYFSPRLADERARLARLVEPGEVAIDLFGGVGPQAVQLAQAGATVRCIDLNPEACALARRNADANQVAMSVENVDAREVEGTADRLNMNLPHGAKDFLDVAARLVQRGTIHYHEILADSDAEARGTAVANELGGRVANRRHIRNYSKDDSHWVFDIEVSG